MWLHWLPCGPHIPSEGGARSQATKKVLQGLLLAEPRCIGILGTSESGLAPARAAHGPATTAEWMARPPAGATQLTHGLARCNGSAQWQVQAGCHFLGNNQALLARGEWLACAARERGRGNGGQSRTVATVSWTTGGSGCLTGPKPKALKVLRSCAPQQRRLVEEEVEGRAGRSRVPRASAVQRANRLCREQSRTVSTKGDWMPKIHGRARLSQGRNRMLALWLGSAGPRTFR